MNDLPDNYRNIATFSLGDSPEMADSGLRDVIAKKQVATCGAYNLLNQDKAAKPYEGKIEIVLDGGGRPGCAIIFHKIDTKRFDEIDEQFAQDEACKDLAEWKIIHEAYFRRKNCFAPDMKIYRLYFEVVGVFQPMPEGRDFV